MISGGLILSNESKDTMLNGARNPELIPLVAMAGRHSTREPIGHDDVDCRVPVLPPEP